MNKILSIKHITGFIVFGMFLLGLLGIAFAKPIGRVGDLICSSPKVQCCPNGVQSCCDPIPCTSSPCEEYNISCFRGDDQIDDDDDDGGILPLPHGCTPGELRYKAQDGCDYDTETCCNDRTWSGYSKKCCNEEKPKTTQNCTKPNGVQGTQTRTVSCDKNTGEWNVSGWTTCSGQDCTPGQTSTEGCPKYGNNYTGKKPKEKTCSSSGYWGSCQCPASTGNGIHNGKPYCEGTQRTVSHLEVGQADDSCWHGIWSDTMCSGICCCAEATPYLDSSGIPGCKKGRNNYEAACSCQTPWQMQANGYNVGNGGIRLQD